MKSIEQEGSWERKSKYTDNALIDSEPLWRHLVLINMYLSGSITRFLPEDGAVTLLKSLLD